MSEPTSFRPISIDGYQRPEARDLGVKPQLQWFAIEELVVDERYQRRISKEGVRAVKRIADAFDWTFFSPIIVAPVENRKFAIIDGQHRTTAAALVGIQSVPGQLVLADPRQQAAAFAAVNGKVQRASAMQIYHAARAAEEPWAVRVSRVAEAAGVTILKYPMSAALPDRPRHSTMSAKTIELLIARFGTELAQSALLCLTRSTLGDDPAVLGQRWMRAMASVLSSRPHLLANTDRLYECLSGLDAGACEKRLQVKGFGVSASEQLAIILQSELDVAIPAPEKDAAA